jgi:hypothetical protein
MGTVWQNWKFIIMANQEKLNALTDLLKEVLSEGQDIDSAEFPFIVIKGDIDGKGIIWTGQGNNKQFLFAANPDKFFVSETVDLAKGKSFSINNLKVLDEKELGTTVTKSNLREVGRLKGLIVDGGLSVNQYLVYDPNTDRLGIGTDQPNATLSIVDQNIELVLGASEPNVGSIGTYNSANLQLVTDNTARVTIEAGGNIILGNPSAGDVNVTVLGRLGVNVSKPDPRSALHVNGALKFNDKLHLSGREAPTSGAYNEGDIVWNTDPQPGKFVGWVCTRAGNPGLWSGFGRIE